MYTKHPAVPGFQTRDTLVHRIVCDLAATFDGPYEIYTRTCCGLHIMQSHARVPTLAIFVGFATHLGAACPPTTPVTCLACLAGVGQKEIDRI